jgi:hypothetical protein
MDKKPAQANSLYTCSMAVGLTHNGPLVRSNKWTNHSWVHPMVLVSLVQRPSQLKKKKTKTKR